MAKKIIHSFTKMADDLLEHPKTIVTAKDFRLAPVHFAGHLYALWSGTKKFAEDGDLSGYDDDMIAITAKFKGDPAEFVRVLKKRGWLDEKLGRTLVHDWIDHQREWLISKYKNRPHILKAVWAKHGRVYGRDDPEEEDGGEGDAPPPDEGKTSGSSREVNGKSSGSGREPQEVEVDQEEELEALSPKAQTEKETKSPEGGAGENSAAASGSRAPPGSLSSSTSGFRAQGYKPLSETMPCEGFTLMQVFEAFGTLFKFHTLFTVNDFHNKVTHCKVAPALWAMVFLDKIQYAYMPGIGGKPRIETDGADPVAMTVRGLVPKNGAAAHVPSEAARQLFGEIMVEYSKAQAGGRARWNGAPSAPTIALELMRRKGKGSGK